MVTIVFASKILVKFMQITKNHNPIFVAMSAIQGFQGVVRKSCSLAGIAFYIAKNIEKENNIFVVFL